MRTKGAVLQGAVGTWIREGRHGSLAAYPLAGLRRGMFGMLAGAGMAVAPQCVHAQTSDFLQADTLLVKPSVPAGFDRGRNTSVIEKARPDYAPLGINVGSFVVLPRVEAGVGASDNIYVTQEDRTAAGFADITPSIRINSDWSRNAVQLVGGGDFQRYFGQSRRNQNSWNFGSNGTYEIGDDIKLTGEANVAQRYESPYSGDVNSTFSVLSKYLTSYLSASGAYTSGRIRGTLAVDRTTLQFSAVDFGGGLSGSQAFRDREVYRVTGEFEYAFSPSISAYAQATYNEIDYDNRQAANLPKRDSTGYRIIAGLNFDLASFLRGTLGAGYVLRNYKSSSYDSVDGPSLEASLEYFPSGLTTLTLRLRRLLEDSSVGSNTPFFDNRISARVDHELLQNLLVYGQAEYGRIHYIGVSSNRNFYTIGAGGTYLATRSYGLRALAYYGKQNSRSIDVGQRFNEVRGQLTFYVQR